MATTMWSGILKVQAILVTITDNPFINFDAEEASEREPEETMFETARRYQTI